jgi:hypothetical protein
MAFAKSGLAFFGISLMLAGVAMAQGNSQGNFSRATSLFVHGHPL